MFSFFKRDPDKKTKKKIDILYTKSVAAQRNGKLRLYAEIMTEIDQLQKSLQNTGSESKKSGWTYLRNEQESVANACSTQSVELIHGAKCETKTL